MTWYYKEKEFTSEDIEDNIGFVYQITNKTNNKKYIGQKKFIFQRKIKRKRIKKESDWLKYFGSCKALNDDIESLGTEMFHREILFLCKSKGMMNWLELKEQVDNNVLLRPDYYNDFLGKRIHRKHIKND